MTSKTFVSLFAFPPRRRLAATTIMYGLSLAVRFTSATGEEVEIPPQSLQRANPVLSVMTNDDAPLPYANWGGPNAAEPIFFRRRWAASKSSCASP
ncbi:hypothetical protein JQ631_05070 [Bradyrhizobium manausense]|jgi:hypothetical protein|uniref:hypothetical protein n=1 Tax=Bradyrhizobium manausense TaxID=989370 RepID=UPI001BA61E19|nr:hypothetical protein [Bradyrhizobium manausense]MBR0788433.1 hypothetical protein [Bradyrhizobium manausense]